MRSGIRKFAIGLSMLVFFLTMHAGASEYAALLNDAANAIDNEFTGEWAFTETSLESGILTVARYNPANAEGDRWQLISVNGRGPTIEEIAGFAEEKSDEDSRDNKSDNSDNEVEEMVEPDSLVLIEETDDHWLFSFTPAEDDDEGFFEHVDATLKIAKDGPYIEYINMKSDKPFRPQFGVKIKEFVTRLSFGRAANNGPIVPISIDIKIKARAFLVKGIDETISITFSDYEYVGD